MCEASLQPFRHYGHRCFWNSFFVMWWGFYRTMWSSNRTTQYFVMPVSFWIKNSNTLTYVSLLVVNLVSLFLSRVVRWLQANPKLESLSWCRWCFWDKDGLDLLEISLEFLWHVNWPIMRWKRKRLLTTQDQQETCPWWKRNLFR